MLYLFFGEHIQLKGGNYNYYFVCPQAQRKNLKACYTMLTEQTQWGKKKVLEIIKLSTV